MNDDIQTGSDGALALVAKDAFGWIPLQLHLVNDGTALEIRLEDVDGGGQIDLRVFPVDRKGRAFLRLKHVAVGYDARISGISRQRRRCLRELILGLAHWIDERFEAAGRDDATIAQALGRDDRERELTFSREVVVELLAPEVAVGRPVIGGWELAEIYPASSLSQAIEDRMELVLDFRKGCERFRMLVKPRGEGANCYIETLHLGLSYFCAVPSGVETGVRTLCALVGFLFQLKDHAGLRWRFPGVRDDVKGLLLPAEPAAENTDADRILNLAVNSDCGQRCVFCSTIEVSPPVPDARKLTSGLLEDLESHRLKGVSRVRINGYDPLAHPEVVRIVGHATALGYTHVDLFSPHTRLADRTFCRDLLAAMPAGYCCYVPLYGTDAATHDRVVGTPGAFARLMLALENLDELAGAGRAVVLSVATRQNIDQIVSMAIFCRSRGYEFKIHMPFPYTESRGDRFFGSAPRHREVVESVLSAWERLDESERPDRRALVVEGVAPCVLFRGLRRHRQEIRPWFDHLRERSILPGTEYISDRYLHRAAQSEHAAFVAASVDCASEDDCALRFVCSRKLLRSYLACHGGAEFEPVSLHVLLEA